MTQTNQNKDYSWQWLDCVLGLCRHYTPKPGECWYDDTSKRLRTEDGDLETLEGRVDRAAKAAIIARIDEHYISKGEAAQASMNRLLDIKRLKAKARLAVYHEIEANWDKPNFKKYILDLHDNDLKLLERAKPRLEIMGCPGCNGEGDYHDPTGEWRGKCGDCNGTGRAKLYTESEVEQRCIEARIAEHDVAIKYHYPLEESADYKRGFKAATEQVEKWSERRDQELREQLSTNNKDTPPVLTYNKRPGFFVVDTRQGTEIIPDPGIYNGNKEK